MAILGQGIGGVPEMRNTISAFEEQSPLYGFLQYRRRKVVIKYMPDGLSRLLQGTGFSVERGKQTCMIVIRKTNNSPFLLLFNSSNCSPLPVNPRKILA